MALLHERIARLRHEERCTALENRLLVRRAARARRELRRQARLERRLAALDRQRARLEALRRRLDGSTSAAGTAGTTGRPRKTRVARAE